MTSKRKLYREDEKLFFLHSYYQSGMSKHAFCRAHGICCPALLNSWIKKYSNCKLPILGYPLLDGRQSAPV